MRILFIDDYPCSQKNGIGTFRNIFRTAMSVYNDVSITLISLNSDFDTACEIEHSDYNEIQVPRYNNGKWRTSGEQIAEDLKSKVQDRCDNIFLLNYSPCAEFVSELKKVFPLSKCVFVIHDQGWCTPLLGNKKLLSEILKGATPEIVSDSTAKFVKDYCSKENEIYQLVDKVVCLSDSMQQILTQIYKLPEHKIAKIENGLISDQRVGQVLSKKRARTMLGIPQTSHVVIYAGRPVRNKGCDALLLAIKLLRRKYPDLRCVFAGDVYQIIKRWNLYKECAANIIMPGFLNKSELRKWYAAADIGALVSYSEQCSYAALEMMDAGLLVVSSDGIGLRDMFVDSANSFVAHIGNVTKVKRYAKRISDKLEAALNTTPTQRKQYASYNRRLLDSKYSATEMAEKYLRLFHSLLATE